MANSIDNDTKIALFQSIGLNEQKARETLKNHDVTRLLESSINQVRILLRNFYSSNDFRLGKIVFS